MRFAAGGHAAALVPSGLGARLVLLVAILATNAFAAPAVAANDTDRCTPAPRIATMDWMLVETLVGIGAPPVAASALDDFDAWVGTTRPPPSTVGLGLRSQPNLELLAQVAPDRILVSPRFAGLKTRLSRIAPTSVISSYTAPGSTWPNLLAATREVARLACRSPAGEQLVADTRRRIRAARQRLVDDNTPVLLVTFVDTQHVRVYGQGSLFEAVLEQLGLANAWTGRTNVWGYAMVGLGELMQSHARMIVIDPLPVGLAGQLARSGLWAQLPAVRDERVLRMPGVWSYGGLPSAARFAEQLARTLKTPDGRRFRPAQGENAARP